jgi:SAM-dependent methyltransferase
VSTYLDDPKRLVADGYDRIAEAHREWASRTRTEERARYAAVLLDALPARAEVLELGCGTGLPTTARLATRLSVTGVDISARSIELARANVPAARFVCADMTRLALPPEGCDAVAAFYSIIHVPRDEHAALFRSISRWLRPGGLLVASLGTSGAAAGFENDWLGAPMFWSGHDAETARRMVADAGLEILRTAEEVADEDGRPVSFLWIVAQKRVP